MECQYWLCWAIESKVSPGRDWHSVPTLRGGRRGFLRRKWPDPRDGSLATLPGMGSHLAGPRSGLERAPADTRRLGGCGWKSPTHVFVNAKGNQNAQAEISAFSAAGPHWRWWSSFLRQGRRGRLSFLFGAHTPFSYFPSELRRRPLSSSGTDLGLWISW